MPKKTVAKIIESGNNYVIQVKGNQASLEQDIIKNSEKNIFISYHCVKEMDRGTTKWWDVEVFKADNEILKEKWMGLQGYVVIKKTELKEGVFSSYKRYFITNATHLSAEELGIGIRKHWGVENNLHRTRDVSFNQDNNKIKTITGAINMAIMNTIAINILIKIDKSIELAKMIVVANYKELLIKWRT